MKKKHSNFWIAVCNFIIKHLTSEDYSSKLDLIVKQGLYHADNGTGPFIIKE